MKSKKERNLRRKKPKKRNRGMPMFGPPSVTREKEIMPKDPETGMDVARLLADEIHKKWPDAKMPAALSGKHVKLSKSITEEFTGDVIRSMIRVLVWDFEEVRKNKAFFPPCNHLNWPWIDQLYNYRHALASTTATGITDSTSRTSAYAQRYLSGETPKPTEAKEPGAEESLKDIARRMLGQ